MSDPKQQFQGTSVADLQAWLHSLGVNTSVYGVGASKPLELLLEEVQEGETILSSFLGSPRRTVSVVNVRIRNSKGQSLYEAGQILPTGTKRPRNLPLSEKMLPGEAWQAAAKRGVQEELGVILPRGAGVTLYEDTYERTEETKESQSYPGLQTEVRKIAFQIFSKAILLFSCPSVSLVFDFVPTQRINRREIHRAVRMPPCRCPGSGSP